jgi:hypothetical protein
MCCVSGGAVHEVPLPQLPFLSLDDQQRLAREHEEVLLIGLPVVHPDRLTGSEHHKLDPQLREVRLGLEVRIAGERHGVPSPLAVPPARLARIEDEPSLPDWHEAVLGRLDLGLRDHGRDDISAPPRGNDERT